MRRALILGPVGVLGVVLGCAPTESERSSEDSPSTKLETPDGGEHWERFLSWWPGDYDNLEQVEQIAAQGIESVIGPTALYIRRVELPAFGEDVYYAEWHNPDDPTQIIRQRFYAFENEGSTLRLNLHIFPPDADFSARTAGAYLDPSKLEGLTPEDMFPLPGCDVFFEWQNDEFAGTMKKQSCNFLAPGTEVPIYSWSQMRLRDDAFQYLDGWFHREDDSVYRQLSDRWVAFKKR